MSMAQVIRAAMKKQGVRFLKAISIPIAYILDPQKTDDAFYVSSYGCAASDAAAKEFEWTRNLAVQQGMQMPKVLARHLIQSFDIGEVTPEEAHEVGKQLADEWLKGKYEYVIATHIDKGLRFLPEVLANDMSENQQVFYAAEQHFNYRGGVYCEMSEMEAQRLVQEKMLVRETKMSQIVDAEKQWRLLVQRDIRELNANPYIINVRNGLYNVLEDTLTEHTPDYYSTVQLAVTYDKKADCPLFKKFLKESMGGDMDQVALIQEMLGYFLIPVNSAQKCFVIVGVASAGKSVLLRVLNDVLLGKQNVSNVSWQALNEWFKTAELFGKLANIFADLPTKNIDDNGIFKALVGEDYLTVEKKNKNPFSFQSSARLLFSCNSIDQLGTDLCAAVIVKEGLYQPRLGVLRHELPLQHLQLLVHFLG